MRRQRSSKPKGSNIKAASPQQPMQTNDSIDHQYDRTFTFDPSGPSYSWTAQDSPSTRLPSIMEALQQDLHDRVLPLPRLPQLDAQMQKPTSLMHLRNTADKETTVPKEWERFSANHKKTKDFRSLPLTMAYDGTKLELGKADGINTSHDVRDASFPRIRRRRNFEPSLYNQESSGTAAAISSGTPNAATRSVAARRLIVKLRYGRHNRQKVANLLRLPFERRISNRDDKPTERSPEFYFGSRLSPEQEPNLSNDGAKSTIVSLAKNNERISPGESSNAVMRRFEDHARELEVASCAATDASHRSISDDEELIVAMPDIPRKPPSEISSEGESPTSVPFDFFTSNKYSSRDEQLGQTTYNELNQASDVVNPDEDLSYISENWTEGPLHVDASSYIDIGYMASVGVLPDDTTIFGIHEPFGSSFVPTIPSSSQQMRGAEPGMAQPLYQSSPAPPDIGFSLDQFSVIPPFPEIHREHHIYDTVADLPFLTTSNSHDAIRRFTEAARQTEDLNRQRLENEESDLREMPVSRSIHQYTTSLTGSISKDSPIAGTGVNSGVDREAQGSGHRITLTSETYTDSGYASNTTRALKSSEMLGQVHQTEEHSADHSEIESRSVCSLDGNVQLMEQEDDVASIYSDASTIPTMTKARYIDGLADDLAQAIQPYHLNDEVFQQIIEKLPELLKAFALTFGHHDSGTMHRDVMVFIHKHRRQIVKTLNDQISMEEAEDQNRDQADQMSLNDKMNFWLRSGESTQDVRLDNPDFNDTKNPDIKETQVDEEDEEDHDSEADETELPGLAAYRSFIRGAPAYDWFLNNIRRECALAPPEPNLIAGIRNTILDALPSSSKISRRKPAETFNVSFMVDWDPVAFLREEEYTERPDDAIERAISLTGSAVSAQALTCGGYLRQTWPSTGEQILNLIKSMVAGNSRASITLLNGSSLAVSYHPSQTQGSSATVWVDAHGTAACVAEIGEQFAWLASALRSSPFPQEIAYSRPFIDGIQIGHATYEETTYVCKIGVELREGNSDSETTNGECWHGLFGGPVVVEGFPIPRRLEEETLGLEIPLNIMASLAQAHRVGSFGGKTVLKGFTTMLLPMKRTKDIVTWHLVQSRNGERISYLEADNFQTADIQMPELEKSRHVLGWCPEMRLYAGAADASYLIKGSRLPRPSGEGGLSDASLSLGHLITGGAPFSEGRKDIRLRRNSYIVRMKWISQKFVILWDAEDKRGWLVNGASALLHLVRASLAQDMFDNKFGPLCLFSTKEFQEASRLHQTDAALEVLLNPNNLKAKIYPEEDDFIRFKAYVEDFSDLLEKMLDYQSRVTNQNLPRSLLEGWDFNDLATGRDPIYPREACLNQEALSWVDFTRSLHAITLFGRSFGEVIQPAKACCSAWAKVPCGRSYLAASAPDLYKIMESDGDPYSVPMRLTHDILWYTSKETFVQCQCSSEVNDDNHCDIAQVLLPSRLQHELSGTCSQLPSKSGAIIFGYNKTHRWFWGDTGDPSRTPNESGRISPLNKGIHGSQFSDSGIGKSLGSSASITGSTSNRLDEEYTEYTQAVNSESEDHQSSSSAYNKRNNHLASGIISSPLATHYKVGIVCALHIELMAVRASFDKTYEKVAIAGEDPNYYALGSIEGHNVVAVCLPHGVYGTNAAADVASNMKRSFPGLKFCLLVGIGAGVPSQRNDIRLGDVVISTPKGRYSGVLPYDMIKSTDSGAFELNGYLSPPPAHLMCAISELESDPSLSSTPLHKYLQQIEQCKMQYTHPGVAHDRLFDSNYAHNGDYDTSDNCEQCNVAYEKRRPPRSSTHPQIHYGLIASGNQVMKSAEARDKLGREHNVLCFEMEGAGIMNNFPCLIIRGICDYADSHKNKRWQNYAAATAAAYAKLLLSRLRTADGFESEQVEYLIRKRTATTEIKEDMPAVKRSRS